jgi:hypothetical protein
LHKSGFLRDLVVALLSLGLVNLPVVLPASAQGQVTASALRIVVVEGDDAINNISLRTAKEPVVRVEDSDGRPVSGATVTFTLPRIGASGSFPDDKNILITQTDNGGQAVGRGLRPNSLAGQFEIRVAASYQGATASIAFAQTNVMPPASTSAAKKKGSGKVIAIVVAAVGGGVGAALAAKGKGGSSNQPSQPPTTPATVIVSGGTTIGPP